MQTQAQIQVKKHDPLLMWVLVASLIFNLMTGGSIVLVGRALVQRLFPRTSIPAAQPSSLNEVLHPSYTLNPALTPWTYKDLFRQPQRNFTEIPKAEVATSKLAPVLTIGVPWCPKPGVQDTSVTKDVAEIYRLNIAEPLLTIDSYVHTSYPNGQMASGEEVAYVVTHRAEAFSSLCQEATSELQKRYGQGQVGYTIGLSATHVLTGIDQALHQLAKATSFFETNWDQVLVEAMKFDSMNNHIAAELRAMGVEVLQPVPFAQIAKDLRAIEQAAAIANSADNRPTPTPVVVEGKPVETPKAIEGKQLP